MAIVSGIFAVYLAGAALISHPFGFCGSAIIMLIWGYFLKIITFAYEPEHFKVLKPEPKREKPPLQDLAPDELPDWSNIVASIQSEHPEREEPSGRVLAGTMREQVAHDRVIGKPRNESKTPEQVEREEDKEWADMFRAL